MQNLVIGYKMEIYYMEEINVLKKLNIWIGYMNLSIILNLLIIWKKLLDEAINKVNNNDFKFIKKR